MNLDRPRARISPGPQPFRRLSVIGFDPFRNAPLFLSAAARAHRIFAASPSQAAVFPIIPGLSQSASFSEGARLRVGYGDEGAYAPPAVLKTLGPGCGRHPNPAPIVLQKHQSED